MHRSLFGLAHEYFKDSASSHTSQAEIDKMPDNSAVKTTLGVVVSDCESLLMHISEIIENDGIWPIVLEMKRESLEGFI